MTPLQFEAGYAALWSELEAALDRLEDPGAARAAAKKAGKAAGGPAAKPPGAAGAVDGERLALLYRRACEHLALAQARAYPLHLRQRLEMLTQRAHRVIYRRQDYGIARLKRLLLVDIPQAVRGHGPYLLVATLLFTLPLLLAGWATWRDPSFALHLMDAQTLRSFDWMYGDGDAPIGNRSASTDWQMFGHYIRNNIGIGFQCFAGGIFAGLGSIFFVLYNGAQIGAVAGYLTARGHGENFWSFVVTHSAFELTAIVMAGAAGLRLGTALLAPGRRTRVQALKQEAASAVIVVYGVIAMLLIAAAVEAFWSSARWITPPVKYGVGACCWALVIAYLGWQGRPARPAQGRGDAG